MTLLENHLEQICLSARAIADMPFTAPKIFANALIGNHEITNLIRDTEPHERALFSVDPNTVNGSSSQRSIRRATAFPGDGNGVTGRKSTYTRQDPRKQSAVAGVLGGEMLHEIQQSTRHATSQRNGGGSGVNVEILLRGAEKLCAVYPVAGASEKIASLRSRYRQIGESVIVHEEKIAQQQLKLERMTKNSGFGSQSQDEEEGYEEGDIHQAAEPTMTEEELRLEEQEIRELEIKKRTLEERVTGMEKDLGGLLR